VPANTIEATPSVSDAARALEVEALAGERFAAVGAARPLADWRPRGAVSSPGMIAIALVN
jgi:hypothetical protein